MTEAIPVRVQHKRMSASDWLSSSLVLLDGELGVESDTGMVKVGNGRDRFSSLQYLTGPKGDRGERGEQGPQGIQGQQGLTGPQGQTGPKGDRGDVGPKGADGVMRFEALTSQQKESLRGPQGPRGATGITGPQGPRGSDGAPGQNIINQNDGQPLKYWFGSKAQYNAIANKDSNTIYDVYE
nr:MAG TPA: hyaluronidase [Caudoviricetes sp.]